MTSLVHFSINNRVLIVLLWVIFCMIGVQQIFELPIDVVPDVTNVQVQVITDSPGYATEEVERLVTIPVELAISGTPSVEQIRSITRPGLSVVTVVFTEDTDIYRARQLISERLNEVRDSIPQHLGRPKLGPISTGLGEIYNFEVRSKNKSAMELRELLDWQIAPRLRTVGGVVEVNSFGGELRTYEVQVDPLAMLERRVRFSELLSAIKNANRNEGGGVLEIHEESLVVRGEGLLTNEADIESVVIRTEADGSILTVGHVSSVGPAPMLRYGAVTRDGEREAVTGIVMMLVGANSRDVSQRVHQVVQEIDASLRDVSIDTFYNRTDLVNRTITTVADNLLMGGGLVIAILLLLMGSLRAGLLVAIAVPISFLGAVIGMRIMGLSGNLMSLGALDFGIIIDGSVVMVEHIVTCLAGLELTARQRLDVVRKASGEMARPTTFGVLIIGVVYLPILSLRGIEGKMFTPMAFAVVFALAVALLVALTLTPALASMILRKVSDRRPIFFRACDWIYGRTLTVVMRRPVLVGLISMTLVITATFSFIGLGAVFLPKLDEGDLALQIARQPQVGLQESLRQVRLVESMLLDQFPEVRTVVSRTGRAEIATDPMGIDFSDVYVLLKPRDQWVLKRTKEQLATMIKTYLDTHIPGVGFSISQPIELRVNELLEGVRADIGVSIYGDDLNQLNAYSEQIETLLKSVRGAGDVEGGKSSGLPQLRVRLNRPALAAHGLTSDDVLTAVAAVGGAPAGVVIENERRFEIRVRLPKRSRSSEAHLKRLRLVSANGDAVPLFEVADVWRDYGPAAVSRESGKRRAIVQVNVRGRDLVSFVTEAKRLIKDQVDLPPGWFIKWGGQFQNFKTATERLLIAVPIALLLIFGLLQSAFASVGRAMFIYLAIPMAACGGVFALWYRQYPFSISAAIGFIALFGVAVLNGLVLMSMIQDREAQGDSRFVAAQVAAKGRLRAVLMTAFTDVIGFLPMALSMGDGAEVQRPLATVVIGGLVTATILTLLVLPTLYGNWSRPLKT